MVVINQLGPAISFEELKRLLPDTKYTEMTYAAFQFLTDSLPSEIVRQGVGTEFLISQLHARERCLHTFPKRTKLRLTSINNNWIYAAPASWPDNFWQEHKQEVCNADD